MSTSTVPRTGLDRLAAVLDGSLARPGDPDWDAARQAWHLAVDQRAPGRYATSSRSSTPPGRSGCGWPRKGPGSTPDRSVRSTTRSCCGPPRCAWSASTRGAG